MKHSKHERLFGHLANRYAIENKLVVEDWIRSCFGRRFGACLQYLVLAGEYVKCDEKVNVLFPWVFKELVEITGKLEEDGESARLNVVDYGESESGLIGILNRGLGEAGWGGGRIKDKFLLLTLSGSC